MKTIATSKKKVVRKKRQDVTKRPTTWEEVEREGTPAVPEPVDPPVAKFPPPANKKSKEFRKYWLENIDAVAGRENFKKSHLKQLEILCDLYVEYDTLCAWIAENGYTFSVFDRRGSATKQFPQVPLRNNILAEIRSYVKMLGLTLYKDKDTRDPSDNPEDAWE